MVQIQITTDVARSDSTVQLLINLFKFINIKGGDLIKRHLR